VIKTVSAIKTYLQTLILLDVGHKRPVNCNHTEQIHDLILLIIFTRQHICYSAYIMLSPVCPNVRLSVGHTGRSYNNGWS